MKAPALTLVLLALGARMPASPESDTVLLLIGDAGAPDSHGQLVLRALQAAASEDPARTTVVFLGDNIYPRGLPAPGEPSREGAERRLGAQLDAVRIGDLRAIFVPGNHDWDRAGQDGWNAVRRLATFVRDRGPGGARVLPEGGCPGPETVDLGARLRLLLLDTQWFLHEHERPLDPTSSCANDSEEEVVAALRSSLESAGERQVVVAAHHPLASGGPHGGRFSARQHLFPLTDLKPWLWIPLPLIGSAYPAARNAGASAQDLSGEANVKMRATLQRAFEGRAPLVYASGHEHNLQVITAENPRFLLVSGAGIYGKTSPAYRIEGSRFFADDAGYMRLAFPSSGPPRLQVFSVGRDGSVRERFMMELR